MSGLLILLLLYWTHEVQWQVQAGKTRTSPCVTPADKARTEDCHCWGGCRSNRSDATVPQNLRGLVTFRINVAFNKPATMSSRANIQRSSVTPEACSAVNGRTSGIMSTKAGSVNCIITQQDDYEAWWRLDLLHPYTITSLKLYQLDLGTNKDVNLIRLRGLRIYVDGQLCFAYPDIGTSVETLRKQFGKEIDDGLLVPRCKQPMTGQYVLFRKTPGPPPRDDNQIAFCEVQIWVCRAGWYAPEGRQCKPCPRMCHYECDNVYGCRGYPGRLSNVAIHKHADQSSVTQRGTANRAVDGFPWNRPPWCALTNPDVDGTKRRWWRVNLAGLYRIYYLIIHTQDTNAEYLNDHLVTVSRHVTYGYDADQPDEESCYRYKGPFGAMKNISCVGQNPVGSYVTVSVPPTAKQLQLCEVLIFGHKVQEIEDLKYCLLTCKQKVCRPGSVCVRYDGNLVCKPQLPLGGPCTSANKEFCAFDSLCEGGICKLRFGQVCTQNLRHLCQSGTVCDTMRMPWRCKRNIGRQCDSFNDCVNGSLSNSHVVCDALKKCKKTIGSACKNSQECLAGAICQSNSCHCKTGSSVSNGQCKSKLGSLGSNCQSNADCTTANTQCMAQKCSCAAGFETRDQDFTCITGVGRNCETDGNCSTGLTCSEDSGGGNKDCRFPLMHNCRDNTSGCESTAVCDDLGDICKRRTGERCKGAHDCQSGTACEGNICKLVWGRSCVGSLKDHCGEGLQCASTTRTCTSKAGTECRDPNSPKPCGAGTFCDENKCKIVQGESCAGEDKKDYCGRMTECDEDNLCKRPLGMECETTADCRKGAICGKDRKCRIKANGSCLGQASSCSLGSTCMSNNVCGCLKGIARAVGDKCVSADRKVDGPCDASKDKSCDDALAQCQVGDANSTTRGTCECTSGYTPSFDLSCVPEPGAKCKPGSKASCAPGSVCETGVCLLEVGQRCAGSQSGNCQHGSTCDMGICKSNLGSSCKKNSDGCITGTVCDSLNTCKIPPNDSGGCVSDAACVAGATCENSVCTCDDTISKANDQLCVPLAGKAGGDCSESRRCEDANAECRNKKCECKQGYTAEHTDLTCKKSIGEKNCTTGGKDCVSGTICDTDRKMCLVKVGEPCAWDQNNSCMTGTVCDEAFVCKLKANAACTGNKVGFCRTGTICDNIGFCKLGNGYFCNDSSTFGECVAGATCEDFHCVCDATISSANGALCEPASGRASGRCSVVDPCVSGATCSQDGFCECDPGYEINTRDFSCREIYPSGPSDETIMGIVAGIIAVLALVTALIVYLIRRAKRKKRAKMEKIRKYRKSLETLRAQNKQILADLAAETTTDPSCEHSSTYVSDVDSSFAPEHSTDAAVEKDPVQAPLQ